MWRRALRGTQHAARQEARPGRRQVWVGLAGAALQPAAPDAAAARRPSGAGARRAGARRATGEEAAAPPLPSLVLGQPAGA
jgi:hypothetical protein